MCEISTSAYLKMYVHGCKYQYSCIGGYLIGNDTDIVDIIPVTHNAPIGPILEIAANIADNIETGSIITTITSATTTTTTTTTLLLSLQLQ